MFRTVSWSYKGNTVWGWEIPLGIPASCVQTLPESANDPCFHQEVISYLLYVIYCSLIHALMASMKWDTESSASQWPPVLTGLPPVWTLTRDDFLTRENCSLIQQFTMRITLRCTLSQSVPSGYRCVQHDMLWTRSDLTNSAGSRLWALSQQIRVSCTSKQTGTAHHAQQQLWPISYIRRVAQTARKTTQTPRRVSKREGTTSSTWAHRQTWLHFSICAGHPNILPTLSHNLIGHGGRCRHGWYSMFISTDFPTCAGSANLKTELLSKRLPDSFLRLLSENVLGLGSLWRDNTASSFPETTRSREELLISFLVLSEKLVLVLHFPLFPVYTVVKPASCVIARLRGPSRVASRCFQPNRKLNVSMTGCWTNGMTSISRCCRLDNFVTCTILPGPFP